MGMQFIWFDFAYTKLSDLFYCPVAKVLDQAMIVGNMKQTISSLASLTGLSHKTVRRAVDKLVEFGLMEKIIEGKSEYYRFKTEKVTRLIETIEEICKNE